MQHRFGRLVAHHSRDRVERLDRADLVVGQHHRDDRHVGPELVGKQAHVDDAVGPDRGYVAAHGRARMQHRMVLDGSADRPSAARRVCPDDRQVVGLGAAPGEDDLPRLGAEALGHDVTRLVERFARLTGDRV